METVALDGMETDLGLADARVPVGSHVCQIFSDDEERDLAMLKFLSMGLAIGEKTACFSGNLDEERLAKFTPQSHLPLVNAKESGAFQHFGVHEVYFHGGVFEPERMLKLLAAFHDAAREEGYRASRVIGEMDPDVLSMRGGNRLLEYEARVSILLRHHPVTSMCQYDARLFDGATIMDVLRVHPMMVVRDMVVRNPFFVAPEQILSES
jgi:hypothetical protein